MSQATTTLSSSRNPSSSSNRQRIITREIARVLCRVICDVSLARGIRQRALVRLSRMLAPALGHQLNRSQLRFLWLLVDGSIDELLLVACRGGGKTELAVIALFILCIGEAGSTALWLSGDTTQKSTAREKIEVLLDSTSPFFGIATIGSNPDTNGLRIEWDNGSYCDFNPTTATRGWRRNLLFFDEEGSDAMLAIDKIRANKGAYKVTKGTFKHAIRIRHFTTLMLGTPAIAVESFLKPKGRVIYYPATDPRNPNQARESTDICPWVTVTENDLRFGEGNVQRELLCHAAADKGSMWIRSIEILDHVPVHCIPPLAHGLYCRITIDWNASAGHAVEVVITDGEDYWIVNEWSGTDLGEMASFINRERKYYGEKCTVIYEWQGGDTQCRKYDLETYHACPLDTPDAWDRLVQGIKIPLVQGLGERGKIHAYKGAKHFIEQQPAVFLDENGKIPGSMVDHALVSFAHGVEPPTQSAVIPMSFKGRSRA